MFEFLAGSSSRTQGRNVTLPPACLCERVALRCRVAAYVLPEDVAVSLVARARYPIS